MEESTKYKVTKVRTVVINSESIRPSNFSGVVRLYQMLRTGAIHVRSANVGVGVIMNSVIHVPERNKRKHQNVCTCIILIGKSQCLDPTKTNR